MDRFRHKVKALRALVTMMMVACILAAVPLTASAQNAWATIDVSTLGGVNADNSANVATDSQWNYNGTDKVLWLKTYFGKYTLTGTNSNLRVIVDNGNILTIFDNLHITATTNTFPTFNVSYACGISLKGTNTITQTLYGMVAINVSRDVIFGIDLASTDGNLTVLAGPVGTIRLRSGSMMDLLANVPVTFSGTAGIAIDDAAGATIRLDHDASLTMINNSAANETHTVQKYTATSQQWKVTGAATLSSGVPTDNSVDVTVASGGTGTISLANPPAVPGAPTIGTATAGNGQATVTFTAPGSDGGSTITGYTVTSSPGGLTESGAASPINVIGLTNGQAYTFTVVATNAVGNSTASSASNSVTPMAPPVISTPAGALTGGTYNTTYSTTLAATNSPTSWTVSSGALPGGLSLNNSGVISGTPTAAGTFNFDVTATNGGGTSAAEAFSIVIAKGTQTAPTGLGKTDETTAAGTDDGTITGTTTAMQYSDDNGTNWYVCSAGTTTGLAPGTYLVCYAETANLNASPTVTVIIAAFGAPLTFTHNAAFDIPASTVGTAIASIDVSGGASGGVPSYTFTSSTLPAGITISTAGVISGTPTTAGAAGMATITVTDSDTPTPDSKNITIAFGAIAAAPVAPTITTTSLSGGTVGTAYSQTLAATGSPTISWTIASGALPGGLTLSTAGVISGTPTAAGTFNFTVQATNGVGNDTKALSIVISAAVTPPTTTPPTTTPPTITTSRLPDGTTGMAYSTTLAATGTGTIKWDLASGTLPAGLTLSTSGVIAGTPTTAGEYTFIVRATNSAGNATRTLTITIGGPEYYIDNPVTFTGGTVTTTPQYLSEAGKTVSLTIAPAAGFVLETITVTSYAGTAVTLSGTGNVRMFTMPAQHVRVAAAFRSTVANEEIATAGVTAYVANGTLCVSGLTVGDVFSVYNVTGSLIYQGVASGDKAKIALTGRGIYIVRTGNSVIKVAN